MAIWEFINRLIGLPFCEMRMFGKERSSRSFRYALRLRQHINTTSIMSSRLDASRVVSHSFSHRTKESTISSKSCKNGKNGIFLSPKGTVKYRRALRVARSIPFATPHQERRRVLINLRQRTARRHYIKHDTALKIEHRCHERILALSALTWSKGVSDASRLCSVPRALFRASDMVDHRRLLYDSLTSITRNWCGHL